MSGPGGKNPAHPLKYFEGYGKAVQAQVRALVAQDRLDAYIRSKYQETHEAWDDKALFVAAVELKNRFLRNAPPLHRVRYDSRLQVLSHALGMHTRSSRVQGPRLKTHREIRVASVFREAPAAFLKMILVHELAHLKETEHTKAFYQLCTHMAPDYFQLEFDLRLYLTLLERGAGYP
jgi:hypothetical protein